MNTSPGKEKWHAILNKAQEKWLSKTTGEITEDMLEKMLAAVESDEVVAKYLAQMSDATMCKQEWDALLAKLRAKGLTINDILGEAAISSKAIQAKFEATLGEALLAKIGGAVGRVGSAVGKTARVVGKGSAAVPILIIAWNFAATDKSYGECVFDGILPIEAETIRKATQEALEASSNLSKETNNKIKDRIIGGSIAKGNPPNQAAPLPGECCGGK